MEAHVHGVSTRKVDDLVAALGIDAGVSKSQVSRICRLPDWELVFELTRRAMSAEASQAGHGAVGASRPA